MSHANLSRRSMLTAAVSIAAVPAVAALPALAIAAPALPNAGQVSGPTAIDLLWKQRQAIKREYKKADRRSDELEAEFERRLPKPHPSIVYGPENDADDLKFYIPDREPHTVNHYIPPDYIERVVEMLEGIEFARIDGERVLYLDRKQRNATGPRSLSNEEEALRNRLLARLELSKQYEQKIEQIRDKIGLTKLTRKIEGVILPRLTDIETRIYSTPAVTQSDLKRKVAVYDSDEACEYTAARLLRDLRRLAKRGPLPNGTREAVQS